MALPYDVVEGAFVYKFAEIPGATPDGADSRLWVPGFNGCIIGGWAAYDTVPTSGTAECTVEVGTGDAIEWDFTTADTALQSKAGTLQTPDTARYFDTDDVVHLDVSSANKSESTLNVWLLVKGR